MQLTFAAQIGSRSNSHRKKQRSKIQRWGQKHRKEKDKQRSICQCKTSTPATLLPKSSGLWPLAVLIYLVLYNIILHHRIIGRVGDCTYLPGLLCRNHFCSVRQQEETRDEIPCESEFKEEARRSSIDGRSRFL